MEASLGAPFDEFVAQLLTTGRYQSQAEILRASLQLLREQEELRQLRLAELRQELAVGLAQAGRGEVTPLDIEEIKAEIRRQ